LVNDTVHKLRLKFSCIKLFQGGNQWVSFIGHVLTPTQWGKITLLAVFV